MKYLKRLTHSLFRAFGRDILRYTPDNFVMLRRAKILNTQNIDLALDIGANEGTYALELRETGYCGRIISFEPLSQSFPILQRNAANDPLWDCENLAIGDSDGAIDINISGHGTSSSILPITERHLQAMPSSATVCTEKVIIARLDSFLDKKIKRDVAIHLKVDVQGFEKHVLEGAKETLKQTRVIELELSLVKMYEGAPTFNEMLDHLTQIGYRIASLQHVFSDAITGNMLQVDGIFVKQN